MSRTSDSRFGRRLCGVIVLGALIFASLLLPRQLENMRTGHWEIEHFLAYLMAVPIICLGWSRPFLVAITLIPAAALLEVLQCLRPDHSPNFFAALSGIGGVLVGALLATLTIRVWEQISLRRRNADPSTGPNATAEG
jgi:hypothetical protein